ncbi:Methyltransferase FkbM domain protein [anaerobic digester metagenome]
MKYALEKLCSAYESLPLLRKITEHVFPIDTVVVLLGENIAMAIEYYRERYKVLPRFAIIDSENSGWFMWHSLAMREHISITPIEDINVPPQQFYVFARPMQTQYGSGCLRHTVEALASKGITRYQLDNIAIKYIPIRPPEPDYFGAHIEAIHKVWCALADENSRLAYLAAVKALVTGDTGYLPLSPYRQYKHEIVRACEGDCIFEGGVCDGKTTIDFAFQVGQSGHIHAFEPMPNNYNKSRISCRQHGNITLVPLGLWDKSTEMRISREEASSRIVLQDDNTMDCETCSLVSLDDYATSNDLRCDMLKLDIEGAEPEALRGAIHTLQRDRPKIQISIYHAPWTQLVTIPLWAMEHLPEYNFYIGHHSAWFPETMLYGIAKEKMACRNK